MPAAYVRPYVKRQKNDATDAEAICEAVTRANMRFVETKTPEQQSCLMLHRTRHHRAEPSAIPVDQNVGSETAQSERRSVFSRGPMETAWANRIARGC